MKAWTFSGILERSTIAFAIEPTDFKSKSHSSHVSVSFGKDADKKALLSEIFLHDVEEELVSWLRLECKTMPRMYFLDKKNNRVAFEFSDLNDAVRFKLTFSPSIEYVA